MLVATFALVLGSVGFATPQYFSQSASAATPLDINVTWTNFNSNKAAAYYGASVGFTLGGTDVDNVKSVKVELFDEPGNLLVTNNFKPDYVFAAQTYSSAFRVKIGTYTSSSSQYLGTWLATPTAAASPAKVVITVTDVNGKTYTAESSSFTADGDGFTPTWASLFDGAPTFVSPQPTISGTPKVGFTLTADAGSWEPDGVELHYQWKADGSNIGTDSTTYALTGADVGKTITVTVTVTKDGYTATSTSAAFSVNNAEVPAPPAASSPVRIVVPVAPRVSVVTEQTPQVPVVTEQTPPPPPVTAQIVLAELGSSTEQLLERYQAANNGDAPPSAAEVLTIAAGELEAGTGAILSTTDFVASMPWAGSSGDQWVDVWAYSTPTYIGTFPVINGVLKITGADLSALAAGDHHLVLVGQTSGASEVMGFAIAEPTTVPGDNVTADPNAATPDEAGGSLDLGWLLWAAIAVLAIAAIATIGTVVRRRRA